MADNTTNKTPRKIIAVNKKARHDYFIMENYEAGVELFGTEVKSVRLGKLNLKDSYCFVEKGEMFASGIHISPYEKGNIFNKEPLRHKRLLMHKKEIIKLNAHVMRDGYTIVPLSVYLTRGKVKIELGLCKGKKLYDKRDDAANRASEREKQRYIKEKERDY